MQGISENALKLLIKLAANLVFTLASHGIIIGLIIINKFM